MARQIAYWDTAARRWCYSTGVAITEKTEKPYAVFKSKFELELHFVSVSNSGAVTTKDYSACTAFKFVVKNNWHNKITGALKGAKTGSIISVRIDGCGSDYLPPATGRLILVNSAGQSETVDYIARTTNASGDYTFTVSAILTYSYSDNDTASFYNPCLIKTENAGIVSTSKATGVFTITVDANTSTFGDEAEGINEIVGCGFEFMGLDVNSDKVQSEQGDYYCFNTRDDNSAVPPPTRDSYYDATESDARYMRLIGGTAVTLTDNTTTDIEVCASTIHAATVEVVVTNGSEYNYFHIMLASNGTTAIVGQREVQSGGTDVTGLVWSGVIASSKLKLRATLTASGANRAAVYRVISTLSA